MFLSPGARARQGMMASYNAARSDAKTRRLTAKLSDFVSVKDFGASGNGIVDDTLAVQSAINAASGSGIGSVYLPAGTYVVSKTLTLSGGVTLIGSGVGSTSIIGSVNNIGILSFTGNYGGFHYLTVGYSGTPVGGANAVQAAAYGLHASNFYISSAFNGIYVNTNAAQYFSKFTITNFVTCGIFVLGPINDCYFDTFIIDASNTTNGSLGGIRLQNQCEAFLFRNGDILRGSYSLTTTAATYSNGNRPAYCRFLNVYFDSSVNGCLVDSIVETEFIGCWFSNGRSGAGQAGCVLNTTDSIGFINCEFLSCGSNGCSVNSGSLRASFNGCKFDGNSYTAALASGLAIQANVNNIQVRGCIFTNVIGLGTQGYGMTIAAGTSANIVIKDNDLTGNASGGMTVGALSGGGNIIENNVGYNPVGASTATVGASPWTYTAGPSHETIYMRGGTVSNISITASSVSIFTNTPATVDLGPNEITTVTYSSSTSTPTVSKMVH